MPESDPLLVSQCCSSMTILPVGERWTNELDLSVKARWVPKWLCGGVVHEEERLANGNGHTVGDQMSFSAEFVVTTLRPCQGVCVEEEEGCEGGGGKKSSERSTSLQ